MTVFFAELSHQLKARNIDIDRLSTYRSRQAGTNLATKEATQAFAKEIAQHMQSLLPSYQTPDTSSQQRILELEAELAKAKSKTATEDKEDKSNPPGAGSKPIRKHCKDVHPRHRHLIQTAYLSLQVRPATSSPTIHLSHCRKRTTRNGSRAFSSHLCNWKHSTRTSRRQWLGGKSSRKMLSRPFTVLLLPWHRSHQD